MRWRPPTLSRARARPSQTTIYRDPDDGTIIRSTEVVRAHPYDNIPIKHARTKKHQVRKLIYEFAFSLRRKTRTHPQHAHVSPDKFDDTLSQIKLLGEFLGAVADGPLNVPVVKSVAQLTVKIVAVVQVRVPALCQRYLQS